MIYCRTCGAQNADEAAVCGTCGASLVAAPAPAPVARRKLGWLWALLAVVVIVALLAGSGAWYYFDGPCGVGQVRAAADQLQLIARRWQDSVTLAGSTSRIALSGPVATMQSVERDTENTPVPKCLEGARTLLTLSMTDAITGFVDFMGQRPDAQVKQDFDRSTSGLTLFANELARVHQCAPFCP